LFAARICQGSVGVSAKKPSDSNVFQARDGGTNAEQSGRVVGISETKIVDQQIRYSLRSPKRRSLILDTNRGLPGISSPPNYYTECGVQKWKIKDRNSLKLMHSSRTLYPVLRLRGVKIVANSTLMVL